MTASIETGHHARILRQDMAQWRLKPLLPSTLDLFRAPQKPTGRTRTDHANRTIEILSDWDDLMFHTRHCAITPRNGEYVSENWVTSIPTPIVAALFQYASTPLPHPTAAQTHPNTYRDWAAEEPPLDTRIQFCRRCLIEPAPRTQAHLDQHFMDKLGYVPTRTTGEA